MVFPPDFPPPTPTNLLLKASTIGDQETARRILEGNQVSINVRNVLGGTPLYLAVDYNHPNLVEYYLSQGANVNTRNMNRETPLHAACRRNNLRNIKMLLKSGAVMDCHDDSGCLPIHVAARNNCDLDVFFRYGFRDVDARDSRGNTPLLLLQTYDSLYCRNMAALLNRGADSSVANNDGKILNTRHCNVSNCPFIKYIKKLRRINYKINCIILRHVPQTTDLGEAVDDFERELETLKAITVNICPKKSLYDCLHLSRNEATTYAQNETLCKIYQRNGEDFSQEFPHYGLLLNFIYKKGMKMRTVRDQAKDVLQKLIATRLPENLSEEILSYMTESQLQNFCSLH